MGHGKRGQDQKDVLSLAVDPVRVEGRIEATSCLDHRRDESVDSFASTIGRPNGLFDPAQLLSAAHTRRGPPILTHPHLWRIRQRLNGMVWPGNLMKSGNYQQIVWGYDSDGTVPAW
jgi:hypothetical protein